MKKLIAFGISLMLLVASARPALAHRLESPDVEPDYIVYRFALILYPLGDAIHHFFTGPHERDPSKDVTVGESPEPSRKPKTNFSPRKKHPQQIEEESQ